MGAEQASGFAELVVVVDREVGDDVVTAVLDGVVVVLVDDGGCRCVRLVEVADDGVVVDVAVVRVLGGGAVVVCAALLVVIRVDDDGAVLRTVVRAVVVFGAVVFGAVVRGVVFTTVVRTGLPVGGAVRPADERAVMRVAVVRADVLLAGVWLPGPAVLVLSTTRGSGISALAVSLVAVVMLREVLLSVVVATAAELPVTALLTPRTDTSGESQGPAAQPELTITTDDESFRITGVPGSAVCTIAGSVAGGVRVLTVTAISAPPSPTAPAPTSARISADLTNPPRMAGRDMAKSPSRSLPALPEPSIL